jgi:H+-transporting ATPase
LRTDLIVNTFDKRYLIFYIYIGDHILIARNTALQLDMGDKIFTAERLPLLDPETQSKPDNLSQNYGDLCLVADGFAQVYPEHKYLIVECLRELGYVRFDSNDFVFISPLQI